MNTNSAKEPFRKDLIQSRRKNLLKMRPQEARLCLILDTHLLRCGKFSGCANINENSHNWLQNVIRILVLKTEETLQLLSFVQYTDAGPIGNCKNFDCEKKIHTMKIFEWRGGHGPH